MRESKWETSGEQEYGSIEDALYDTESIITVASAYNAAMRQGGLFVAAGKEGYKPLVEIADINLTLA